MSRSEEFSNTLFPLTGQRLNIVPPNKDKHNVDVDDFDRLLMSTNKDDLPPLYHGSATYHKPGTILTPRPDSPYKTGKRHVFATSWAQVAGRYAAPEPSADKTNNGVTWGVVHKVEPVEDEPVYKDVLHGKKQGHFLSKQFRVLEATHLVDEEGRETPLNGNKDLMDIWPPNRYNTMSSDRNVELDLK